MGMGGSVELFFNHRGHRGTQRKSFLLFCHVIASVSEAIWSRWLLNEIPSLGSKPVQPCTTSASFTLAMTVNTTLCRRRINKKCFPLCTSVTSVVKKISTHLPNIFTHIKKAPHKRGPFQCIKLNARLTSCRPFHPCRPCHHPALALLPSEVRQPYTRW